MSKHEKMSESRNDILKSIYLEDIIDVEDSSHQIMRQGAESNRRKEVESRINGSSHSIKSSKEKESRKSILVRLS